MQMPITCDTLGSLDGGSARQVIDSAIRDAVRDLDERGVDGKARKVAIVLTFKTLDSGAVACQLDATARVPAHKAAVTIAALQRGSAGQTEMVFNDLSPDAPDQKTIDQLRP